MLPFLSVLACHANTDAPADTAAPVTGDDTAPDTDDTTPDTDETDDTDDTSDTADSSAPDDTADTATPGDTADTGDTGDTGDTVDSGDSGAAPVVTVYDVTTDFSDTANPNGAWAFYAGSELIPTYVSDWAGIPGQSAWANSAADNGFVPAFFVVSSTETGFDQLQVGDFGVHSQDDGAGAGFGVARVVWTSPAAGTVDIDGGVWLGRDLDRANDWSLSIAGTTVSTGSLSSGDAYDRATPDLFADGATTALTGLPVAAGDEVVLTVERASDYGEATGVVWTITLTE